MLPPDQLAFPHKEDLHHCVCVIHRQRDDIAVLHTAAGNLLLLGYLFDTGQEIPVFRRLFVFHLFSCIHHLMLQLL